MTWQDILFTIGSINFVIALIPSIRGPHKPPVRTSVMTAGILYSYAAIYISYSLWFALITGMLTAFCWTILAVQKWREREVRGRAC